MPVFICLKASECYDEWLVNAIYIFTWLMPIVNGNKKLPKFFPIFFYLLYVNFGSHTKYLSKFSFLRCGWRMREFRLEDAVRGVDLSNNGVSLSNRPPWSQRVGLMPIWNPSWLNQCPSWSLLVGLVSRWEMIPFPTQDPFRWLLLPGWRPISPQLSCIAFS